MPDLVCEIQQHLQSAIAESLGPDFAQTDPLLRPSTNPKFGDYQANVAMSLAKQTQTNPRELAQGIVDKLDAPALFEKVELAGPGFINLTLNAQALAESVRTAGADERLGVAPADPPQRVVVDYSSPNVAKQMHVGHLRSTIIGDAITRVLEFLGHDVVRQNHVGDWGTQFGMLIENLLDEGFDPANPGWSENESADVKAERLTGIYQASKQRFDADSDFAERARQRVVKLQAGDEQTLAVWQALVDLSRSYFADIYARLGVQLHDADIRGESFYNDRLPGVVERLEKEGHLVESQGARVVYPPGFKDREGEPLGMIVQKSDKGYLYATTDLAAALYRVGELGADRVIYVIGVPQRQHFEMFTAVLRQAGWMDDSVRMDFVGFGSVLGKDRKMFKTRSGESIKLADLITEAQQRARQVIEQKNPDLDEQQKAQVARVVGVGALKYADLSNDRIKDYVFDWNRMLALDGNTAPYLQNAYVRIRSIFRKGQRDMESLDMAALRITDPAEKTLGLKLLQWPSVVQAVADSLEPHRLCTYLYELAGAYHGFYESCPVLTAQEPDICESRLVWCAIVARTLRTGLDLLGIETVEQM